MSSRQPGKVSSEITLLLAWAVNFDTVALLSSSLYAIVDTLITGRGCPGAE